MLRQELLVTPFEKFVDIPVHTAVALALRQLRLFELLHRSLQVTDDNCLLLHHGLHDDESGLASFILARFAYI